MFCPNCGGMRRGDMVGGSCRRSCIFCGHSLFCRELFGDEIEKESLPIRNPLKALLLRIMYISHKENRLSARERVRKHRNYQRKLKEDVKKINQARKRVEKLLSEPRPPIQWRDGTGELKKFKREKNKAR